MSSWPKQIDLLCSFFPPRLILSLSHFRVAVMVGAPDSTGHAGARCHTLAGSTWLLMAGMCLWGPPESGYCCRACPPPSALPPQVQSLSLPLNHPLLTSQSQVMPVTQPLIQMQRNCFGRKQEGWQPPSRQPESTVTRRHHNFGRQQHRMFSVSGVGTESLHHVSALLFFAFAATSVCQKWTCQPFQSGYDYSVKSAPLFSPVSSQIKGCESFHPTNKSFQRIMTTVTGKSFSPNFRAAYTGH